MGGAAPAVAHAQLPQPGSLLLPVAADEPAPALLLAQDWTPGRSPEGFLVSEKLDGVRACWDGTRLRSRSGLPLAAPAAFMASLPARQPLDGELWLGRGRFDETSAVLRRQQPAQPQWAQMRYMVFELPPATAPVPAVGGAAPADASRFAERCERLRELAAHHAGPQWQPVVQRRVADAAALERWLAEVVAAGGEGLMLHWADAPYQTGRQPVLAKYKPVQDAEAEVLAHLPGRGRLVGKVGALWVRNALGQTFRVGSGLTDALREAPPPVGSLISYAWRGLTANGLPRFPTLVRLRPEGL